MPDLDDPQFVSALDELPFWSAAFGQVLLDSVLYRPGARVLDIGSGTGFPALQLAQRFGKRSRIVALDPWRAAGVRLRHKVQCCGIENLTLIKARAERIPFADSTFDLITSNNGLNNVEDWRRAWRECARVARPGAQLVVTENTPETMLEFYACFREALRELHLEQSLTFVDEHIYSKRKPLDETQRVIAESGFELMGQKHGQFTFRYADAAAFLDHSLIRWFFRPSWIQLVPETARAQVFQRVEERLNTAARAQGSVTMTIPFVCFDCRKFGAA